MNKKSKLISIFFLASLLFISTINVGKAAPPSWVGVNAGDSFTWTVTVYRDTAITLATDLGFASELPPEITGIFGTEEEVQIEVDVLSITDIMTIDGTEYVNVICSASLTLPGSVSLLLTNITTEDLEFGNLIIKYVASNYTGAISNVLGGLTGGPTGGLTTTDSTFGALFIPTNLNWATLIAEINAISGMIPGFPSGLTFTALANGTRATFTGQTLALPDIGDVTLSTIQVTIIYNDDGVLSTAEIKYGGDVLLLLALTTGETDSEIPSYEVSIVLITTLVASIGIIYYIKKKKRIG